MGVLGSVNKAPRECSLLLCTAPADRLPSVGRPPGVDLQGCESLWMQGKVTGAGPGSFPKAMVVWGRVLAMLQGGC